MKQLFEDPTLRLVLFDMRDVLTASPENPDEEDPDSDLPPIDTP